MTIKSLIKVVLSAFLPKGNNFKTGSNLAICLVFHQVKWKAKQGKLEGEREKQKKVKDSYTYEQTTKNYPYCLRADVVVIFCF